MQSEKKSTFFGGAAILMVGVIIVKIIGAVYKIPLMNILGEVGYGHFSAAYAVFNVLLTISTAGLPVALSQAVAQATTLGRKNQARKTFRVALLSFVAMGLVGFLVMFLGAEPIAQALKDSGAVLAIRALAPCVFFVCGMAAFRGYYQGHGNMTPTSVSQIIEAALKLLIGLGLTAYVVGLSFPTEAQRLETGAAAGILGVTIGSGVAFVLLVGWFIRSGRQSEQGTDTPSSAGTILSQLIRVAVPITVGASASSIVSLIDTGLVLERLQVGLGMTEEVAVGLYGTYQGCMTLYNLPAAFMIPFTAAVIPAISAACTRQDYDGAGKVAESALRISALLALPMAIGLSVLAHPIIALLYPKLDVSVAGPLMAVLGIASFFVCISLVCSSILQAHGHVVAPVAATLVGAVVKLAVNYVLVGIPEVNIFGAPVGTLACFAVVAAADMLLIRRMVPQPPRFIRAFAKPLAASLLMGGAAWAACGLATRFVGVKLGCVCGVAVGGLVYLILVVVLKVFSKDDLALMPKGDKIAKILRIS